MGRQGSASSLFNRKLFPWNEGEMKHLLFSLGNRFNFRDQGLKVIRRPGFGIYYLNEIRYCYRKGDTGCTDFTMRNYVMLF